MKIPEGADRRYLWFGLFILAYIVAAGAAGLIYGAQGALVVLVLGSFVEAIVGTYLFWPRK